MIKQSELYLTHLAMQRDGGDAQVPEHQRHPLGVVTRAAKNHEGVPSQFVQDGNQVTVLQQSKPFKDQNQEQTDRNPL